jgi:hypothetical protein
LIQVVELEEERSRASVLSRDKARLAVDAEALARKHDVLSKEVTVLERSLRCGFVSLSQARETCHRMLKWL